MIFEERLQAAMQGGNLTVADLARWFGRPHPTVLGWTKGGGLGGPHQDVRAILEKLCKLEGLIKKRKGFPVPQLAPKARIAYLAKMAQRNHQN